MLLGEAMAITENYFWCAIILLTTILWIGRNKNIRSMVVLFFMFCFVGLGMLNIMSTGNKEKLCTEIGDRELPCTVSGKIKEIKTGEYNDTYYIMADSIVSSGVSYEGRIGIVVYVPAGKKRKESVLNGNHDNGTDIYQECINEKNIKVDCIGDSHIDGDSIAVDCIDGSYIAVDCNYINVDRVGDSHIDGRYIDEGYINGDYICVSGTVSVPDTATNPGTFDQCTYLKHKGYYLCVSNGTIESGLHKSYSIEGFLYKVKNRCTEIIDNSFDSESAGIVKAMLVADKSTLDKNIKRLYSENGIAHIMAISGVHVAIIGMSLYELLRKMKISRLISGIFSTTIIILYGIMTGMSSSTERAVIMLILSITADYFGRRTDAPTSMGFAMMVMALSNPYVILDAGFQLSFAAIIGVTVVAPELRELLKSAIKKQNSPKLKILIGMSQQENVKKQNLNIVEHPNRIIDYSKEKIFKKSAEYFGCHFTRNVSGKNIKMSYIPQKQKHRKKISLKKLTLKLFDALVVGIASFITTTPIIIYYYYQFPPYSIFLNLIVIPLVSLIVGGSILVVFVGLFSMKLAIAFTYPVRFIFLIYKYLCISASKLPGASVLVGHISINMIAVYYLAVILIFALLRIKKKFESPMKSEEKSLRRSSEKEQYKLEETVECNNCQFESPMECKSKSLRGATESKKRRVHNSEIGNRNSSDIFGQKIFGKVRMPLLGSKRWKMIMNVILLAVTFLTVVYEVTSYDRDTRVVYMDVGQGDGILLRTSGHAGILIDGGSSSNKSVGEYVMAPVLKYYGVSEVEYAFVSHGDADHVSGLEYLLNEEQSGVRVVNLVLPEYGDGEALQELKSEALANAVNIIYMKPGDNITYSREYAETINIKCLYPDEHAKQDIRDANDLSMVLKATITWDGSAVDTESSNGSNSSENRQMTKVSGRLMFLDTANEYSRSGSLEAVEKSEKFKTLDNSVSFLFVGDAGTVAEKRLIELYGSDDLDDISDELACDILKVGHHGSKNSSSGEFLEGVSAMYGIVSCGKDNKYGHPHAETLERLEVAGTKYITTKDHGAIIVTIERDVWSVSGYID